MHPSSTSPARTRIPKWEAVAGGILGAPAKPIRPVPPIQGGGGLIGSPHAKPSIFVACKVEIRAMDRLGFATGELNVIGALIADNIGRGREAVGGLEGGIPKTASTHGSLDDCD